MARLLSQRMARFILLKAFLVGFHPHDCGGRPVLRTRGEPDTPGSAGRRESGPCHPLVRGRLEGRQDGPLGPGRFESKRHHSAIYQTSLVILHPRYDFGGDGIVLRSVGRIHPKPHGWWPDCEGERRHGHGWCADVLWRTRPLQPHQPKTQHTSGGETEPVL